MFSSYEPLTTVAEACKKAGLTSSKFNKLVKSGKIKISHRGSNTLYVDNQSLAAYIEINGGQVERYKETVEQEILKAKVKAVTLKEKAWSESEEKVLPKDIEKWSAIIKEYKKQLQTRRKLIKGFLLSENTLDKHCENGGNNLNNVVIDNANSINFTVQKEYKKYIEFFETFESTKLAYETQITYELDKSVIADIEAKYRKKFHIDSFDKGGK